MRNKAQAIVERTPIGELDVGTWLEVEEQLHWWANQRTPQSVKISFILLDRLVSEQLTLSTGGYNDVSSFLNRDMIYALVCNWREVFKQSANHTGIVFSPQKLLFELDKLCAKSPSLHMSGTGLAAILDASLRLCRQGNTSFEAAVFCEVLWERQVQIHYKTSVSEFRPDIVSFNSVLSAWTICARPDRAQAFLERVPHDIVTPNNRSYNILLSAYAKVGDGHSAELLLEHMCHLRQLQQELVRQGDERSLGYEELIGPDVVTWNTAISAWAKSSFADAASRAQALLTKMCDSSNALSVRPDLKTLNTVLACWSRSGRKDGPDRCLGILQQIKDLYATGELESPPDVFSYSTAIDAYTKAGRPSNAEDLFIEMYRGFMHHGHTHLKPDLLLLTSLLKAWGRSGQVEQAWAAFGRIRELHDLGILPTGPDVDAYNIMISCLFYYHKDLSDCVVKADTLLQEMKQNPNTQPDMRSYAYALQTWLLTPDGLDRAVELAREAMDLYSAGRKRISSSDYLSVKAIILAFCKTGYPVHAQNVLFEWCELARANRSPPPEIGVFGSLVDAWRKSEDPEASLKADVLVKKMKQLPISGGLRDVRSKTPRRLLQKSKK
jgi:pentatricopeptide repeat protein